MIDRILIFKNNNCYFGKSKTKKSNRNLKKGKNLKDILKRHKEQQLLAIIILLIEKLTVK